MVSKMKNPMKRKRKKENEKEKENIFFSRERLAAEKKYKAPSFLEREECIFVAMEIARFRPPGCLRAV